MELDQHYNQAKKKTCLLWFLIVHFWWSSDQKTTKYIRFKWVIQFGWYLHSFSP